MPTTEGYRTSPDQETTAWPPGIPYIIGNEACERFSYYGMRAILFVHLVALYAAAGEAQGHANELARYTTHLFFAGVYALPMIGAIIADRLAGKYQTILYLSLFYCLGHAALSLWENWLYGIYIGLTLIALGAGGIKPCVSANVGDQFGKGNWFRVRTVYQIFYFSINFGSFFATIMIPRIKAFAGPLIAQLLGGGYTSEQEASLGTSVAFAIPGILMGLATFIFWLGRRKFVHVPPRPGGTLGLLDTLSSTALFLSLGHLFFTSGRPGYEILAYTLLFLLLGLALFAYRQRLQPDDGFLAVMFYTLGRFLSGQPREQPVADDPLEDRFLSGKPPQRPVADGPSWLRRHAFWGHAVDRFGDSAAEGPVAVLKVVSILCFIIVFWALFDQHASSWIEQAGMMQLSFWGNRVLPNEIQALNPLLVMLLIPLLNVVYAGCDALGVRTPPLGRMAVGMFMTALSFVAAAQVQTWIDAAGSGQVTFLWQVPQYVLLTVGEVMVSVTALEFAYTQAPKRMKSTVMSFLNLTVTLGNVLVAMFSKYFEGIHLVNFFWTFAGLMAAAGVLFSFRSLFYVQRDFPQE